MRFCAHCKKEIPEGAVSCPHCGHTANTKQSSGQTQGIIIKQNLGKLWLFCMLGGLAWGVIMSVLVGLLLGPFALLIIPFTMVLGAAFGAIMGLFFQLTVTSLEKKWTAKREEIAASRTIIADGAANLNKNGGRLFLTVEAVEFYAHKANLDTSSVIIPRADVQDIRRQKNDLIIVAGGTEYRFVVNYCDRWLEILASYRAEMNERIVV